MKDGRGANTYPQYDTYMTEGWSQQKTANPTQMHLAQSELVGTDPAASELDTSNGQPYELASPRNREV